MSEINWESKDSADWYDRNCDHQFQKGQFLISKMKIKTGESILDLGCGTGQQAVHVAGIIGPSGRIVGIDPSSERIRIAQQKIKDTNPGNIRFMTGQAENLSIVPENSVDHVYFCSSFHWVDDKKTALNEVFRVLKPGGTVGMTTPERGDRHMMGPFLDSLFEKYHLSGEGYRPRFNLVSAPELANLLSGAGFSWISIEPRSFPGNAGSVEKFLKRFENGGRFANRLRGVPDEIREKIVQEITDEFHARHVPGSPAPERMSLFTIAQKPLVTM